ncbi:MAG: MMPL family transporter, partial [Acidimicrobiales bacterium]
LLVLGLTEITSVSFIVEFLIALVGLGVAIDYSLLVVTRWREVVANGLPNEEAVLRAMESAGRAVVFSGVTVAISLLALVVLPVSFLRSMGLAGFFIPLVSVGVAVTLLPMLLATVGPKVDRPRIRKEIHASKPWTLWAKLVLHYRVLGTILGAGILVALLIPLTSLHLGEPSPTALAQKGSYHATLDMLQAGGVPNGVLTPIEVLTTAQAAPAVADAVRQVPGVVASFATVEPNPPGGTGIVDILPAAEPSTSAGAATVNGVTHTLAGMQGVLGIGGDGPSQSDFISTVYGQFPLMLGLIAIVTFLLLTRAFRSIVLALKAVIFNVASVGAAFGVTVVVWQWGHGSKALWDIPATGSITVWVPMMVFAFLFGLSMDYEVFILTRVREEYDRVGSTDAAVVTGIGRTGRLVTSAALILFLAFLAMSTAPDTDVKVLATGLGAGILLDALVVRSLLVPALVGVLGKWNWYLPDSVARVMFIRPKPKVAVT